MVSLYSCLLHVHSLEYEKGAIIVPAPGAYLPLAVEISLFTPSVSLVDLSNALPGREVGAGVFGVYGCWEYACRAASDASEGEAEHLSPSRNEHPLPPLL